MGSGGPVPSKPLTTLGEKFGESLGGSQATPSFWKVSKTSPEVPELPRKFPSDFQDSPEVPGLPRKFPDFRGSQLLSLVGSLTPSPDSQKLR